MPALTETSGPVTVSGLVSVVALPVNIHGSGAAFPISYFSGSDGNLSLNINISGGTAGGGGASNVSGNVVQIAATSGLASGLAVSTSVSGDIVSMSGVVSVSGDVVYISGTVGVSSGGVIPVSIVSGSQAALSGLNVIASVTSVIPGYQSGTLVTLSGIGSIPWGSGSVAIEPASQLALPVASQLWGWDALSGYRPLIAKSGLDNLFALQVYVVSGSVAGTGNASPNISGGVTVSGGVQVSGNVHIVSASGNIITDFSGAINVNISGGSFSVSGDIVSVSGVVSVSGDVVYISGTVSTLSGSVLPVALSGNIASSGSASMSGLTVSGAWVPPVVPVLYDYSGHYFYPFSTYASGVPVMAVYTVSGDTIEIQSGATLPVSILSGSVAALSGLVVVNSGQLVPVASGGTLPVSIVSGSIAALSGLIVQDSGQTHPVSSGGTLPVILVSGNQIPWKTYSIYFSGNLQSGTGGVVGFYNPGTVALAEVQHLSIAQNGGTSERVGWALVRSSGGLMSGLGVTNQPFSTADGASTVSGYVISGVTAASGMTQASGNVILDVGTIDANNIPESVRDYGNNAGRKPTARSGESIMIVIGGVGGALLAADAFAISIWWAEHG